MIKLSTFFKRTKINRKIEKARNNLNLFLSKNQLNKCEVQTLQRYKNSKTLCVLGSGESINAITPEAWEYIKQHDSLSLNNTILHKFVPSFIFYETDADTARHKQLNKLKFDNLVARSLSFQNVPIIWHYQPKRYFDLKLLEDYGLVESSYFQGSYSLPGEDTAELEGSLDITLNNGSMDNVDVGLYRRGSVARILHFACAMKYQEVILFGVDLVGTEYFFDSYTKEELPDGCHPPRLEEYQYNSKEGLKKQNQLHMTIDPSVHKVTMLDVIELMNEHWFNPQGIKLFTGSKKSALFGKLPFKEVK